MMQLTEKTTASFCYRGVEKEEKLNGIYCC